MNRSSFLILSAFVFLSGFSRAQESGQIIETVNSPTARHECGAVAFDNQLFLIGGRGIKHVEIFNPKTNSWKQAGKTPFEIHHFQPVVYGDEIYILSAFTGKFPRETPLEKVWIYNPKDDQWREGPVIPENRRRGGGGVLTVGDKIYVAGGIIDGHHSGTIPWTDVFDPKTGKWVELSDMPHRRDHTVAAGDDQHMYLLGGRTTDYHEEDNYGAFMAKTISKVDRFNFSTGKWDTLAKDLPVATAGAGAVMVKGKIYYMGGETGQLAAHNEIQVYDINTGKWEIIGALERGRHGTQPVVIGDKMYIAAGSGNKGGGPELSTTEAVALE